MTIEPINVFNFQVKIDDDNMTLCEGSFSECSGLEATMEPFEIKEGGFNYGPRQRVGTVSFATVVLKRGISKTRHLWQWFDFVNQQGKYAFRLNATIFLLDHQGQPVLSWRLLNALPVKVKLPDLSATSSEVGIEELHIAHEGLFANS